MDRAGETHLPHTSDARLGGKRSPSQGESTFDASGAPGVNTGVPRTAMGGAVAQLGERLTGSQEVDGSIPFSSTILRLPDCAQL